MVFSCKYKNKHQPVHHSPGSRVRLPCSSAAGAAVGFQEAFVLLLSATPQHISALHRSEYLCAQARGDSNNLYTSVCVEEEIYNKLVF